MHKFITIINVSSLEQNDKNVNLSKLKAFAKKNLLAQTMKFVLNAEKNIVGKEEKMMVEAFLKHCGKREKTLVTSIFPFPHNVLKTCLHFKSLHCMV